VPLLLKEARGDGDIEYDEAAGLDATGCHLWPCSTVLASVVLMYGAQLGTASVLELGCGTGFPGLVARRFAKRVVLSDRNSQVRSLARRSSDLQPDPVEVASYGWSEDDPWPPCHEKFDLVLASDTLYHGGEYDSEYDTDMLNRFFRLVDWSLAARGTFVLTHVERNIHGHHDVTVFAQQYFDVERIDSSQVVPHEMYSQSQGIRIATVFLCTRRGETPVLVLK